MNETGITDFTAGKIVKPLLKFTLPVLAALFLQAMYGAVDLLVVGQFAATADVSAVSTGSQIMQTVTFIIADIAMGATILIAQKIGEQKTAEAAEAAGGAIALFFFIAVGATVGMIIAAPSLAAMMNAPAEAYSATVSYVTICSAGMVFIVGYNLLGSVFRGIGDSKTPLLAVGIACVCNIGGDLLLVAVFHMGAAGAAIATAASQAASVVLCVVILKKRGLPLPLTRKNLRFRKKITGRILRLGAPIAFQDLLVSISFLVILAIVNALGLTA